MPLNAGPRRVLRGGTQARVVCHSGQAGMVWLNAGHVLPRPRRIPKGSAVRKRHMAGDAAGRARMPGEARSGAVGAGLSTPVTTPHDGRQQPSLGQAQRLWGV